jgi:hypothetical protein
MRKDKGSTPDEWAPNVSGPDGRSTINEVPGANADTPGEIVELFNEAAAQDPAVQQAAGRLIKKTLSVDEVV